MKIFGKKSNLKHKISAQTSTLDELQGDLFNLKIKTKAERTPEDAIIISNLEADIEDLKNDIDKSEHKLNKHNSTVKKAKVTAFIFSPFLTASALAADQTCKKAKKTEETRVSKQMLRV